MIIYLLANISIPFLSPAGLTVSVLYLPLLAKLGHTGFFWRAWRVVGIFGILLTAVQLISAVASGEQIQPRTIAAASVPTLLAYSLLLSLGGYLLKRIPAAELQAALQKSLQPLHAALTHLPGRGEIVTARIGAIAALAFSMFIRLRSTAHTVREAVLLRSGRKLRPDSTRTIAVAFTRLGTELALGTADALILRGYDPDTPLVATTPDAATRQLRRSLSLELLPLLVIAGLDILFSFLLSA